MRTISFHNEAFDEYNAWARTDKKLFARLHKLILDTARDPFGDWKTGTAKRKSVGILVPATDGKTPNRLQGH